MFNFGQSFGVIKGVCAALKLPIYFVRPMKWKKHFNLIKTNKDASRTKAIEIYPSISNKLSIKKDSHTADAILTIGMLITVFYAVWFFAGSPQRVRHLLPIYPLVLIFMSITAIRGANAISSTSILAFGISATLIIQLSGAALYSFGSIKYLIGDQSREQFISQRISNYSSVAWINQRLKPTYRVYITQRELAYLINAPVYLDIMAIY